MRKWFIVCLMLGFLVLPVSAMEISAPTAPESAQQYMPKENETFAEGLLFVLKTAFQKIKPELSESMGICYRLVAAMILLGLVNTFSQGVGGCIRVVGAVILGLLLLEPAHSMIRLGADTINELSEYSKLLIPVMTAAVAAQGGITSSAALYTGTVFFNTLLGNIIAHLLVPGLYIYLSLCVANCALEQDMLKKVRDFAKWLMIWGLKTVLYIFTGYIGITGVVSGTVDASALKAAKLTISGAVPVVGGILSDASETILVSAGLMKSSAGVYGILAVLAICIGPFLKIGLLYLLLKFTGSISQVVGYKPAATLVEDFSGGMGMVLAMTGAVCVLLLVSLVCFMKGMGG